MVKENLWDHLQSIFPQNTASVVREAVCEVGSLPALKTWRPSFENWYDALEVVEWGIPLVQTKALSDEITNLKSLRQKIGSAIANKGKPGPGDLAEMDVAALMVLNKAQRLKRVKEEISKTPDFHIQWDDHLVELEVTKALPRETHIELHDFADDLVRKILALELPWIITVYFATKLSDEDIQSLLKTLRVMNPGRYKSGSGKWWLFVQAPAPAVQEAEFNTTIDFSRLGRPHGDDWPSRTAPAGGHVGISIYNPEEGMISVRVICVIPGVPVVNYINPLDRKAEDIQGSGVSPFIVAVDIENLADGYIEYQRLLPMYLKEHLGISAVLLFQREAHANKFGWTWELHLNSDAKHPLPSAMLQNFPRKGSFYWPYLL